MKKLIIVFILIITIIVSVFYGLAAYHYRIFPYRLARKLNTFRSALMINSDLQPSGRWARLDPSIEENYDQAMDSLGALPYLQGYTKAPEKTSVTVFNPELAYDGINFFISGHKPAAFLTDMAGNVLHQWSCDFDQAFPDDLPFHVPPEHKTFWRRAVVTPDGTLFAIFEGVGLVKLQADSTIEWATPCQCHHHLDVAEDGMIYALSRHETQLTGEIKTPGRILEDEIAVISPDGEVLKKYSIIDLFLNSDYAPTLLRMPRSGDPIHTNTIEIVTPEIAEALPMLKAGQLLISMRELHTIAVADLESEKIVWADSGLWGYQHQPTFLEGGNILLFDNRGMRTYSRVIEFNPLTDQVVWKYVGDPPDSFFSGTNGSNMRLPNGNTLITESDRGRAFEVTPQKEIVWEFLNPHRAGDNDELIATLFELLRYPPGSFHCDIERQTCLQ